MANFQTLTQINDLIQKLEILKTDKENLRKVLKNAKLVAATELWKYEQNIRTLSSQKQKSIAHKQGLLLFKEAEEDLSTKLKAVYESQVQVFLPQILDLVIQRILEKAESGKVKVDNPELASTSEFILKSCQITGTAKMIALLPAGLPTKKSKINTPEFLQITLPGRVYLIQPETLVATLVDKIITRKLSNIAQIKLLQDINPPAPEKDESLVDMSLEEDADFQSLLEGDEDVEISESNLTPEIDKTTDKLEATLNSR